MFTLGEFNHESLCHDAVHGYLPFTAAPGTNQAKLPHAGMSSGNTPGPDEVVEQTIIDHPWMQRLRQIHQLQTAWWVFPTAEHTRFQHVLGVMHLGSLAVQRLYASLQAVCPDVPSRGYIESLVRMAGLLHDVGHGPFGHFLDDHFLCHFGLTHETLGARIITDELGPLLRGIRRNPFSSLEPGEQLDPQQIALLIQRPRGDTAGPRWLHLLRSLFSGLYTIDNLDFVLRDAYMSGYNTKAFDLSRLLHYSFFTEAGLTIHPRGLPALVRFIGVRGELFRSLYFHRTVRAIDLTLAELFADSRPYLFAGNPAESLAQYQRFTESSLWVDVSRWSDSADPVQRALGERWDQLLRRQVKWKMAAERTLFFDARTSEQGSIFHRPEIFERVFRDALPIALKQLPLRFDLARHVHRPGTSGPTAGLNFVYDESRRRTRPLSDHELFSQIPLAYRICRVYAETHQHDEQLNATLDTLLGGQTDSLTNM